MKWISFFALVFLGLCSVAEEKETALPPDAPTIVAAPTDSNSTKVLEAADDSRTPTALEPDIDQDTPVSHEEISGDMGLTGSRPWRAPDFSQQPQAMGYSEQLFTVPAGLEKNFQFWLDIYTKYTTDQGVLHDSENIDLIYEALDFSAITVRNDLDNFQKERLRTKMVKNAKKRIIERLKKLAKIKDPIDLPLEEQLIWDYMKKVDEKNKFIEATHKSRLRFQLGQRDRIIQGIFFSGRYLEDFEKIFKDTGIPIELTRLPFVESSYNVLARSKVGASGLWQIMPKTGRPYGMINAWIDKRNHPIEATKLAGKLLKFNFDLLQSWPLAITGYNHGPHGVLRLTRFQKTREIADLALNVNSRKRLGFASRNFYVSFLAVLEAEKKAPFYFGAVKWSKPLGAYDIKLESRLPFAKLLSWFDGDQHKLQIFNPHISALGRKVGQTLPKKAVISIPLTKRDQAESEIILNLSRRSSN